MTYASIWKNGGAVQRVTAATIAFGDMPFLLSLEAIWSTPGDDDASISWVRDVWQEMQRHSTRRMYLNFPGLGEGDNLVRDAYGAATDARLQEIKRIYDPDNIFRMTQNNPPRRCPLDECRSGFRQSQGLAK